MNWPLVRRSTYDRWVRSTGLLRAAAARKRARIRIDSGDTTVVFVSCEDCHRTIASGELLTLAGLDSIAITHMSTCRSNGSRT